MYENQRGQLDQQVFNMDQSNFALQGMKDNQVFLKMKVSFHLFEILFPLFFLIKAALNIFKFLKVSFIFFISGDRRRDEGGSQDDAEGV